MMSDIFCPHRLWCVMARGMKTIEISLKDIVTYFMRRDGVVGPIWRQIVESVCVHLHLCAG
jgi:hypothetical protein